MLNSTEALSSTSKYDFRETRRLSNRIPKKTCLSTSSESISRRIDARRFSFRARSLSSSRGRHVIRRGGESEARREVLREDKTVTTAADHSFVPRLSTTRGGDNANFVVGVTTCVATVATVAGAIRFLYLLDPRAEYLLPLLLPLFPSKNIPTLDECHQYFFSSLPPRPPPAAEGALMVLL